MIDQKKKGKQKKARAKQETHSGYPVLITFYKIKLGSYAQISFPDLRQ